MILAYPIRFIKRILIRKAEMKLIHTYPDLRSETLNDKIIILMDEWFPANVSRLQPAPRHAQRGQVHGHWLHRLHRRRKVSWGFGQLV